MAIKEASGAGKSKQLHILCLVRPSKGDFFLNNEDITKVSPKQLTEMRNKIDFLYNISICVKMMI